jgi:hypothetical protein
MGRTLTVQRSKTAAGERMIALNFDAFSAVLPPALPIPRMATITRFHDCRPRLAPDASYS